VAGLTVQRLTRAAKALVATAARRAACLHVSRAVRAACRRSVTAARAGSAGGPKPGRAGFYLELGRRLPILSPFSFAAFAVAVRAIFAAWDLDVVIGTTPVGQFHFVDVI